MPFECVLPELGENIDSAEVSSVLVAVGDTISAEQDLIEVETGKAAMPIPSPVAGVVKELRVNGGDSLNIGDVFLIVEESGGAAAAPAAAQEEPAPAPAAEPALPLLRLQLLQAVLTLFCQTLVMALKKLMFLVFWFLSVMLSAKTKIFLKLKPVRRLCLCLHQ